MEKSSVPQSSYHAVSQYSIEGPPTGSSWPDSTRSRAQKRPFSFRGCLAWPFSKLKAFYRGEPVERPKIALAKSRSGAAGVCLVHLLPVLATVVLAAINLKGLYIGSELAGGGDQGVKILCLQATAKLLELAVVASLGLIVLDVMRHFLLSSDNGLPLGLAGVRLKFANLTMLLSTPFWTGIRGLRGWRAIPVALFVTSCCLIATFIGPSSALLAIPTMRTDWPAGGTSFWLSGNESTLWPDKLDTSSVGGEDCLSPSSEEIYAEIFNRTGCIWYYTASLARFAEEAHFVTSETNVSVYDGLTTRLLKRYWSGDSWAISSMAHIDRVSFLTGLRWINAAITVIQSWSDFSPYKHLYYRVRTDTVARTKSQLPCVRVKCGLYAAEGIDSNSALEYPYLPLYASAGSNNNSYLVAANIFPNISNITTEWLQKPQSPIMTKNGTVLPLPSAFLAIQMPGPSESSPVFDNATTGVVFTCSVDARWARGSNEGMNIASNIDNFMAHGEVESNAAVYAYADIILPTDDGSYRQVDLDKSWLDALTPALVGPGWTTLSSIFQSAGFDNSTGLLNDWATTPGFVQELVSLLVADGMSRVGLSENPAVDVNSQQSDSFSTQKLPWLSNWNDLVSELITGGVAMVPPDPSSGPSTELKVLISVSGYSYLADGMAYYLALTVVFAYILLATGHILFTLRKRYFFQVWDDVNEVLALAHNSLPSAVLRNTSAGIKAHATNKLMLKVRATERSLEEPAELHLLVGPERHNRGSRYSKVEAERKYA